MGMLAGGFYSQETGLVVMTDGTYDLGTNFSGSIAYCGVRFGSDGTIDIKGDTVLVYNQHVAGEWWSNEPQPSIGSSYDVRALSTGKTGTWSVSAAADDTWIQISSDREWWVVVAAKLSPANKRCKATFEIRKTGTGSALDSCFFDLTARN